LREKLFLDLYYFLSNDVVFFLASIFHLMDIQQR